MSVVQCEKHPSGFIMDSFGETMQMAERAPLPELRLPLVIRQQDKLLHDLLIPFSGTGVR